MRHFAELYKEDPDKWGIIGLVHDIDYEMYPDQHCIKTREILEKVLYTIDELTGLITAACLMRPSKSILDLEVKSVKKKWKQKSFAAGVNREVIAQGAERLGMDLNDVIKETINGMKKAAEEIGLKGNL
jgi:predicted hydrolase (HD superfamily)